MMPKRRTKIMVFLGLCALEVLGLTQVLPSVEGSALTAIAPLLLVALGAAAYCLTWRYYRAKERLVETVLAGESSPAMIRAPRAGLTYIYAILGVFLSQLALRHLPIGAVVWSAVVAGSAGLGGALFEIVHFEWFRGIREQLRQIAASQART